MWWIITTYAGALLSLEVPFFLYGGQNISTEEALRGGRILNTAWSENVAHVACSCHGRFFTDSEYIKHNLNISTIFYPKSCVPISNTKVLRSPPYGWQGLTEIDPGLVKRNWKKDGWMPTIRAYKCHQLLYVNRGWGLVRSRGDYPGASSSCISITPWFLFI